MCKQLWSEEDLYDSKVVGKRSEKVWIEPVKESRRTRSRWESGSDNERVSGLVSSSRYQLTEYGKVTSILSLLSRREWDQKRRKGRLGPLFFGPKLYRRYGE